ncbi:SMP-30/gluconolactonase/LRE family protein [Oceaniglobus ichthyenteri]|uniref:SMP-30/gluconolactonase/LRE family protein n=1 Tax=Oceaniglobus ichthyenteri TaxID=2136177 RepID=UPI000D367F40|nr:SMP-30/gluconolactonase/LRE family protein [Oceaniglobus ichthyenteri]
MYTNPTPVTTLNRRDILAAAVAAPVLAVSARMGLAKTHDANTLYDSDAELSVFATGFGFTEGITWVAEGDAGYLLFSDIPANVVYRAELDGSHSVYLEKSGYQKPDLWRTGMRFNNGKDPSDPAYEEFNLSGSNGLTVDGEGRLVIATWGGRSIDRIEPDGTRTVLADRFDGKRFGGTNDVVVARDGRIYFADGFGGMPQRADDPSNEMGTAGIYMIREGVVSRVIKVSPDANGLAFSPDEKTLYVNNSGGKVIRKFDVNGDGTLTNEQVFADLSGKSGAGITDGMKVDVEGNLWTSGPGGIHVFSPQGEALGFIETPSAVANLTFGGPDRKTLFIAARSDIFSMPVNVAGQS